MPAVRFPVHFCAQPDAAQCVQNFDLWEAIPPGNAVSCVTLRAGTSSRVLRSWYVHPHIADQYFRIFIPAAVFRIHFSILLPQQLFTAPSETENFAASASVST